MSTNLKNILVWLAVVVSLVLLWQLFYSVRDANVEERDFTTFYQEMAAKKIKAVKITGEDLEGEDISATGHPKIGIWRHRPENWERLCAGVEQLVAAADTGSREEVVAALRSLVPEFQPENGAVLCKTATAVAPAGTV